MKAPRDAVRYAVVGLGHIAQAAVLPAFAHAGRNSELTALVSSDPAKRRAVSGKYGIEQTFDYRHYDDCLEQVDAVYIALPNSMHAEYTIRAAKAGVHVLCEKPMAVTASDCERMINACEKARVKLMIAYRLHFEGLTLEAADLARRGRLGELKYFSSSFSMRVKPENIRTKPEMGGGTLYDIGVYCINAARVLFRAEPLEVMAMAVNSGAARTRKVDESTAATLRFDRGRVATFVTSFNAADVDSYDLVGTKGQLHCEPAYEYADGLAYELTIDGKKYKTRVGRRDQFAPELMYFSDCILRNRTPEPSGDDGLQDVRIIQALYESSASGKAVELPPYAPARRPSKKQQINVPPVKEPQIVHAESASE